MLTTTVAPTSGTARLAGFDVGKEPLRARSVSSVVFQDPVVDRALSGRRHLELHARLWRAGAGTIGELVERLGLSELIDRPVRTYRGGARRAPELPRARVEHPQLPILDEPN